MSRRQARMIIRWDLLREALDLPEDTQFLAARTDFEHGGLEILVRQYQLYDCREMDYLMKVEPYRYWQVGQPIVFKGWDGKSEE
jgi:hypothetical protein